MVVNSLIIVGAAILLVGLLFFEKEENTKGLLPVKACLSMLFILACIVQSHPIHTFYRLASNQSLKGGPLLQKVPLPLLWLLWAFH